MIRFFRAAPAGDERGLGVKNKLSHSVDVQWFLRRAPHVHSESWVLVLISVSYPLCPGDGDAQTVTVVSSCRGFKAQATTSDAVERSGTEDKA